MKPHHSQHKAKRQLSQNFLVDTNVIQSIINAINPRPQDHIIEIGPGKGALTRPLLQCVPDLKLDVLECDRDLIPLLQQLSLNHPNLTVHHTDALQFDLAQTASETSRIRVIGNLPYHITTPLLFHLLRYETMIDDIHVMVQQEVARRMTAAPDCHDYGRLSVMLQYHCQTELLLEVAPDAFQPRPKVRSSIVRLTPYRNKPCKTRDEKLLAKLVLAAFNQRRKTLHNCLKPLTGGDDKQIIAAGIDPKARPQNLSVADFVALSEAFYIPPTEKS